MLNSPKHVQLFPCIRYMVNNFENADISETEFILYWIKEMRKKKIPDRDINKYLSNLQLNTIGVIAKANKKVHTFNELDGIKVNSENNYISIADEKLNEKYQQVSNCTCKTFFKNFNIQNISSKEYRETLCSTCPYSKNYTGQLENVWQKLVTAFKNEEGYKSVIESIGSPDKYFKSTIDLNTYHGIIATQEHFTVKIFLALFNFLEDNRKEVFAVFDAKAISTNTLKLLLEPLVYLSLDGNKVVNYERIIESILVELYNDIAALSIQDNVIKESRQNNNDIKVKMQMVDEDQDSESLSLDIDFDADYSETFEENSIIPLAENSDTYHGDDVNYDDRYLQECVEYTQETINYMQDLEEVAKPYTTLPLLCSEDLFLEIEKNKLYRRKIVSDNTMFGLNLDSLTKLKRKKPRKVNSVDDFSEILSQALQANKTDIEFIESKVECTSLLSKSNYQSNDAKPIVISQYILDELEDITIENSELVISSIAKDKVLALECVYSPYRDIFIILFNRKIGYMKVRPSKAILERLQSVFEMNSIAKITYMPYALLSILYNNDISCKNVFSLYTALGCVEGNYAKDISEFGLRMITKPFYNEEYILHMIKRYPAVRLVILDEIRTKGLEIELDNLLKRDIILGNSFLNHYIYKNCDYDRYLFELKGFNRYITNDITDAAPRMQDHIFFNIKINLNVLRKDASIELYYLLSFLVSKNFTKKYKIYISQFNETLVTFLLDKNALSDLRDIILNELTNRLEDYRRGRIKGPLFEYLTYINRSQ